MQGGHAQSIRQVIRCGGDQCDTRVPGRGRYGGMGGHGAGQNNREHQQQPGEPGIAGRLAQGLPKFGRQDGQSGNDCLTMITEFPDEGLEAEPEPGERNTNAAARRSSTLIRRLMLHRQDQFLANFRIGHPRNGGIHRSRQGPQEELRPMPAPLTAASPTASGPGRKMAGSSPSVGVRISAALVSMPSRVTA
jgi:hypothetical protein